MIRAGVNNPERYVIMAGLSEGNISRLKAGFPIRAEFSSFGVDVPGVLQIIYGPTEADIEQTLEKAGLIGPDTEKKVDPLQDQESAIRRDNPNILILAVGLPCSGKSTWAKRQSYPIVSPDSIRLALHGQKFQLEAERFVWASAHLMVESLFLAGHQTVILDATNTTKKRRDEWLSLGWKTFFHLVDTTADVCKERAVATGRQDLLPVIDRMQSQWEPLGEDESRWPT